MKKVFKFSAIGADGSIVSDFLKADNISVAKKVISEMGYKIKTIEVDPIKSMFASFKRQEISIIDLKEIVSVFYNTIRQGISPTMVVDTIPDMFQGNTRKQALRIKTLIQTQGLALSKVFELVGMDIFIVKAIESTEKEGGNLEEVLGKVVTLLDILAKGERELSLALINPKIILSIIVLMIYTIYGFAMEKALGFFENHLSYGTSTKIIIFITNLINANRYISGAITILIVIGVWKLFTTKTIFAISSFPNYLKYRFPNWKNDAIMKFIIDSIVYVLRAFVSLQENYELMKICYFIDLLYSAGVKPDVIVKYLAEMVDSKYTKKMLLSTIPNIRSGMSFDRAFKQAGFKQDFVGFLRAGAETSALEYYMVVFADNKKRLFENSVLMVSKALPIIILLLAGSFIIFTFAGIYLPMFNFK